MSEQTGRVTLPRCPKCEHTAGGTMDRMVVYFEIECDDTRITHSGDSYPDFEGKTEPLRGPNGRLLLFCGASHVGAPKQQRWGEDHCGFVWEAPEGFELK